MLRKSIEVRKSKTKIQSPLSVHGHEMLDNKKVAANEELQSDENIIIGVLGTEHVLLGDDVSV